MPEPRKPERLHDSRQDTERRTYERLRETGFSKDAARKTATQAAEQTHRTLDKRG